MNDLIQELFDVLDTEYRLGGIDPRSFAALKAHLMVFRRRVNSVDYDRAIDLYRLLKKVIS